MAGLRTAVEDRLWPAVSRLVDTLDVAGVAIAVVRDDEVVIRGFGVRDLGTGEPVTDETMFHLASVSKPFVATAVVSLALSDPRLDLDAPLTDWVPEFSLADGRAPDVTARLLLSHTSGLPDVSDFGWHDPQLGDEALADFARSLSGWRLKSEPGSQSSYSNAGYELLGLLLARVLGTTFEQAMRQQLLDPLGLRRSTFVRAEVPAPLAASPHVAMPLTVPAGSYPYTRRHAPSSTLHSNVVELCRWMAAHFESGGPLQPELLELMWRPVVELGSPPFEEGDALGWEVGSYGGHRTLSHSGADPGFGCRFVLVPERRIGVVALANSNTVFTGTLSRAALDVALSGSEGPGLSELAGVRRPVAWAVASTLAESGHGAALSAYHRLAAAEPDDEEPDEAFEDAVWGAIELHRTDLVWPLLRVWTDLRPESSVACAMTGWAYQVDGDAERARALLTRALDLDPDNEDAALILSGLPA